MLPSAHSSHTTASKESYYYQNKSCPQDITCLHSRSLQTGFCPNNRIPPFTIYPGDITYTDKFLFLILAYPSTIICSHIADLRFAQVRRDMFHQVRVRGAATFAGFEELQLKYQIIAMLSGKIGIEWIAIRAPIDAPNLDYLFCGITADLLPILLPTTI